MTWLDNDGSEHYQQYIPYGFGKLADGHSGPSIGFNGQWSDPGLGWYHLGNGYRVYNPVLMVFHSPDSWIPERVCAECRKAKDCRRTFESEDEHSSPTAPRRAVPVPEIEALDGRMERGRLLTKTSSGGYASN